MNFENLYNNVLEEKKPKHKTNFDHYNSIRKPTPPTGTAFKDKSKYSRKAKHKKNIHEAVETPESKISSILSSHGIIAADPGSSCGRTGEGSACAGTYRRRSGKSTCGSRGTYGDYKAGNGCAATVGDCILYRI